MLILFLSSNFVSLCWGRGKKGFTAYEDVPLAPFLEVPVCRDCFEDAAFLRPKSKISPLGVSSVPLLVLSMLGGALESSPISMESTPKLHCHAGNSETVPGCCCLKNNRAGAGRGQPGWLLPPYPPDLRTRVACPMPHPAL